MRFSVLRPLGDSRLQPELADGPQSPRTRPAPGPCSRPFYREQEWPFAYV